MLSISPTAAEAIGLIASTANIPEGGGIRISAEFADPQQARLDLSLAESPELGDAVVQEQGANVFVEKRAAAFLENKLLDASVEEDRVSFAIVDRQEDWSQNGHKKDVDPKNIA